MNNKLYLAALSLCLSLGSCMKFSVPEIKAPPRMVIQVVRWVGSQPVVRINTPCYNQNDVGFTFKGVNLDMRMNGFLLGKGLADTTFFVAAHQAFIVPVYLQMDAVGLGASGIDLTREVSISADGTVTGSRAGFTKSLPLHYKGQHIIDLKMNYPVDGH